MWIAEKWQDYELLDCGDGQRLERWGSFNLVRPDPQAIWEKSNPKMWKNAHGKYTRSNTGGGSWDKKQLPESWTINYGDLKFGIKPMNFKHTGIFPEQAANWAQPLRLYRRSHGCRRQGGSFGLSCRRRQRYGGMGKGQRQAFGSCRRPHKIYSRRLQKVR